MTELPCGFREIKLYMHFTFSLDLLPCKCTENTNVIIVQCSIDTLLERTIKHMLFLQGVTSHADKLKKCTESNVRHHNHALFLW